MLTKHMFKGELISSCENLRLIYGLRVSPCFCLTSVSSDLKSAYKCKRQYKEYHIKVYTDLGPDSVKCNMPQHYKYHTCRATIADSCASLPQQITRARNISSKENSLYGFQRWNVLLEGAEGYLRDFFVS